MNLKTDEFGCVYYLLYDNSTKFVIIYEYKGNFEENVQEGQHREEVVFEITNSETTFY